MHASCLPHPADYAPLILTMKTSLRYCCYLVCESDNCYQFKTFVLRMYSRGVSPRIPSNLMTSQHPHGICLHSLILISQSAARLPVSQSALSLPGQPISVPSLIGPCPPMDCINHETCCAPFILTLTSRKTTSTTLNHLLHPHSTLTTQLPTSSVCYHRQHPATRIISMLL